MSNIDRCSICGDYDVAAFIMNRPHRCPPLWYCRTGDDLEDEATRIYARDAEDAACELAQELDSDGTYGDGSHWTILVQSSDSADAPWVAYDVRGEPTVEYTATREPYGSD